MKITFLIPFLLIITIYAAEVVNVAPGIFSNGLRLPASKTSFLPINVLTTTVHLDKSYSVFVHYQFTLPYTKPGFLQQATSQ